VRKKKKEPQGSVEEFLRLLEEYDEALNDGAMVCYDVETGKLEVIYPDDWSEKREEMAEKDKEFLSSVGIKP